MNNAIRTLAMTAALGAMLLGSPVAARSLSDDGASAAIPGHAAHNRAPDAPPAAITWRELMDLEIRVETPAPLQTIFHVTYPDSLLARDGTVVRIKGFMYPLEAGETHTYFLLSAFPPSCPFCLPASARGLVEVMCDEGVRYTLEPVVLEGRFELLEDAATGLHYRLGNARDAG